MPYKLTREDVAWGIEESAAIRAAGNSNPAVLHAILDYHKRTLRELAGCSPNANVSGNNMGTYESPLTAAIRVNHRKSSDASGQWCRPHGHLYLRFI